MVHFFTAVFIIPLLLTLLLTPLVIKLAVGLNIMDQPGRHKIHKHAIPRLGGLAVVLSVTISLLVIFFWSPQLGSQIPAQNIILSGVITSFLIIFLLGLWDDVKSLSPEVKCGIQLLAASIIYLLGFNLADIINPGGTGMLHWPIVNSLLTVLWIVGITNAFNLIDGLDGLAPGVSLIAYISIFFVSVTSGQNVIAILALIFAGALIGFLRYNITPSKIFLGDSGSLFIGFTLAILSVQSIKEISADYAIIFPILLLALPITDTLTSINRRLFKSEQNIQQQTSWISNLRGIFIPDKLHIHHKLILFGFSQRSTVLLLYLISGFFAISAIAVTQTGSVTIAGTLVLICLAVIMVGIHKLNKGPTGKKKHRPEQQQSGKRSKKILHILDLFSIITSISFSIYLVSPFDIEAIDTARFSQITVIIISVEVFTLWVGGLYRRPIHQISVNKTLRIIGSVLFAALTSMIFLFVVSNFALMSILQLTMLNFFFLLTFILGVRITYQLLQIYFSHQKYSGKKILIYGANLYGNMILHKVTNASKSNIKILGFLDDNSELDGTFYSGYPVFGGETNFIKTLNKAEIKYILTSEHDVRSENFKRIQRIAISKGIQIKRIQINLKNILLDKSGNDTILAEMNNINRSYN